MKEEEQKKEGKKYFLDDPSNVKRFIRWFFISCALVASMDLVFLSHHKHVEFSFESIPLFYCFYGLVACVLLVVVAKQLRKFLMRKEDYYDR